MMNDKGTLKYTLFSRRREAEEAKAALDQMEVDCETVVVTGSDQLTHDSVSLGLTRARTGALLGAFTVPLMMGLTLFAVLAFVSSLELGQETFAPWVGGIVLLGISSLFGALAGGLAYSTELRRHLSQLRLAVQRYSHPSAKPAVLVTRSEEPIESLLAEYEPLSSGVLR